MVDFSKKRYLSEGGAGKALILDFHSNSFDGNMLISLAIKSFGDLAIGSFTYIKMMVTNILLMSIVVQSIFPKIWNHSVSYDINIYIQE